MTRPNELIRIHLTRRLDRASIVMLRNGLDIHMGIEQRTKDLDTRDERHDGKVRLFSNNHSALLALAEEVGLKILYGWKVHHVQGHPDSILFSAPPNFADLAPPWDHPLYPPKKPIEPCDGE